MSTRGGLSFKGISLILCIFALLSGCAIPQTQIVQATATPVSDGELIIGSQIQSTLDNYNAGLNKNDKTLYLSTIDQSIETFRTSAIASFDSLESSGFPHSVKLGMTLNNVELINQNLVLAHIERDRDGWLADWYFRKTGDTWVISELYARETGTSQTTILDNYTFVTYPVMDIINEKLISLRSKAQEHVRKDLGEVPSGKVEISIFPSASVSPAGCNASGWNISTSEGSPDAIYILSPATWCFGFYDPQKGWESDIEVYLSHELARITYVRNFGNPGEGVDWFFEGLAEYVAGYDEMPDVIEAVQSDRIIPILDTSSSQKKVDLAHFANLDDTFLAYGLSESLVTFIVEKYGRLDSFWALARAYDETHDMRTAIQNTLGVSYEQFDTNWREWLKDDYIKR